MSETSETYSRWYEALAVTETVAERMVIDHNEVTAPSERYALAERARRSARWLNHLAETMDLHQPPPPDDGDQQ